MDVVQWLKLCQLLVDLTLFSLGSELFLGRMVELFFATSGNEVLGSNPASPTCFRLKRRERRHSSAQEGPPSEALYFLPCREVKLYRMLVREERWNGRKGSGWIVESLCEPYAVRVARTVTRGVRVYTCSVVVGPTHPICSMIYGSTGATHFDQLAKILTGYEITGARSSGLFMGILSIAVGSLFKITAVPFRAAIERTAAYRW
ncbi:hypothetical protein RIF29_48566 [Crotalaria pallida]|uniref:NADH:quinone oxidoreductase/Mrp antiporter transmembrane domain-containing protein n=1 Tax=Crotalaria pallida TaxID=3830 RepID=A0AAN9DR16_CROPI